MNRRIFASALFAAAMIALPMASARADCAAEIEKTLKSFENADIAFAGPRDRILSLLDRARQKLNDGKKKGCEKLVVKARQLIAAQSGAN